MAKKIIFIAISLIGFLFYVMFDKQVFPAASIDLKLSPAQAEQKSRELAQTLGFDTNGAIKVTTFTEDDDAKTVLEFKEGIDKANQLMKDTVPVWLWRTRYCRELSQDELDVTWTTEGKFKSFFHTFENDRKIRSISQDEAQALATRFITDTAKFDLTGYELFDKGSEKTPVRTDHHFVWRHPGFKESEFRVQVKVAGNQISSFRYWLNPSDTWTREYKGIRQWNELLGSIASFLLFGFIAATLGAFLLGVVRHNIRWRFTLTASAVVALLVLLEAFNNFSYSLEQYETKVTFAQFLLQTGLNAILECLGAFLASVLIVGGAEVVYRSTRLDQTSLANLIAPRTLAQNQYWSKTVMGYLLVGVMMFWTITYYKLGQKLGYFCPLGVDDYKVLGNFCPAISGALIGVSAAGLEEFTCRVVGLGLLQKVTRSFWLANILQALIWGFAHSTYPQEPCYARGIELTVVGLLFGYIVKNYGVLPCFVAHYLYDAFLTVEPVFASRRAEMIVPALLILIPFVVAVLMSKRWARSKNIDVEKLDMSNAAEISTAPPEHSESPEHQASIPPAYKSLSSSQKKILFALTVVCLALGLLLPSRSIGEEKKLGVSPLQATRLAEKILEQDGLDHSHYEHIAVLVSQPDGSKDSNLVWQNMYEKVGFDSTRKIYDQTAPGLEWKVRFFKRGLGKSYIVYLNADGSKRSVTIDDLDEAPGASVGDDRAQAMVEDYIRKNRPEFMPFTLDTRSKVVQAKRVDYSFDFVVPKFALPDTPAILHADLKGDKVSSLALEWKVPDQWSWPHKKEKLHEQIVGGVRLVAIIIVLIAAMIWTVHLLRSTVIPWRLAIFVAVIWTFVTFIDVANGVAKELLNYNTAESFENFISKALFLDALRLLLSAIGCFLLSVSACAALQKYFISTRKQLSNWFLFKPAGAAERLTRTQLWLDGALSSYAFCAVFLALKSLQSFVLERVSPTVPLEIPSRLSELYSGGSPALELIVNCLSTTLLLSLVVAFAASFWQRYFVGKIRSAAVVIVLAIVSGVSSWYWQVCVVNVIFLLLRGFAMVYFVRRIFRTNALSYIATFLEIMAATYLSLLISQGGSISIFETVLAAALLLLPLLLALVYWRIDVARK